MLNDISAAFSSALGIGKDDIGLEAMVLRCLIIYVSAIVFVKLGEKRFMGRNSAFDVILGIMLGSILSRAVTGNSAFWPTLAVGALLVATHWCFSVIAFHWDAFGSLVKGGNRTLVKDGQIDWDSMRRSHISKTDLEEYLRKNGSITDPEDVALATFERSGEISVVPRRHRESVKVLDIAVRDGVQTVRIELN